MAKSHVILILHPKLYLPAIIIFDMAESKSPKPQRTAFGERLRKAREEIGYTQLQVAEKLKMGQSGYSDWETGSVEIKPDRIEAVAAILRTSVCELFGEKLPGQDRSKLPGKGLRLLEEIAKLPQEKQDKIFKVMVTLLDE
jgi:transcriptional regulator with XRE-family HTH domain